MCGIAGEVSYSQNLTVRENDFLRMQRVLAPRGPDQQGMYLSPRAALVHRRLAVIDIDGGRQPMRADIGGREYVIVYNGELYNTQELRGELQRAGYVFETRSDTEVVLKSFLAFGEKCVGKFNGIFAFAVWDEAAGRLFAARVLLSRRAEADDHSLYGQGPRDARKARKRVRARRIGCSDR